MTDEQTEGADNAKAYIEQLAVRIQSGDAPPGVEPESEDDLKRRDIAQDIALKKRYANALLLLMAAQVVIANVLVYLYAGLGRSWDVPTSVVQVWLGATVVELVGVVAVVTRYLFAPRPS